MHFVSVIIPTYNRSGFIRRAVKSVLNQTYKWIEIIIVDDGSIDDTVKIISTLGLSDNRIRCLTHKTNRGSQAARNTGIRAAKGEYIAFLDSDDEWLPNKLEKQMPLFSNMDQKIGVVYAGFIKSDQKKNLFNVHEPCFSGSIYKEALRGWIADTNTLVVHRDVLFKSGLWDERIRAYQEWDLCIRLSRFAEFAFIKEPLAIYHIHNETTISKDLLRSANGYSDVVSSHYKEMYRELGRKELATHFITLGALYLKSSDIRSARSAFLKAIRLQPASFKLWGYYLLSCLGAKTYRNAVLIKKYLASQYVGAVRKRIKGK